MEAGTVLATPVQGLTLRYAGENDISDVLGFIRALAKYEHLEHEMVATADGIRASLFGERKVIDVVLADFQGAPAGFALYFYNFSTFLGKPGIYLEDLFVHEHLRGNGIGTALLSHLAQVAREQGCGRLEWSVLDWNEPSIQFYKSLGAVLMDEWTVNRVTGDALVALADKMHIEPSE